MSRTKGKRKKSLAEKYPASEHCGCEVCLNYCARPGWWTVEEAVLAMNAGYGSRMMLEMSADRSFGVLSPAFPGCEGGLALNIYAPRGCNFLDGNRCELHGTVFQPLECRYCHHERKGSGQRCHEDIEKDWNTPEGHALVVCWGKLTGLWKHIK